MGMFERLRDDSPDKATDRAEIVAGLVFAAGVAAALGAGGEELRELDTVDSLVWIFVTGIALGFGLYWLLGSALSFVVRWQGGTGSPRRARHILAFAFAPLVFAIAVWLLWPPLLLSLVACSAGLLLLGLREVYGWSLARAAAAVALSLVWLAALAVCLLSVLVLLGRVG